MVLTKQYLAFKPSGSFNLIASGRPNINFLIYNKTEGRYCAVGAAENVAIIDLRINEKVMEFRRDKEEVTCLRVSPDRMHIAVGYIDGVVQIFEINTQSSICSLALHKSAVAVLCYDKEGIRLISGGMDNEVFVIDIIGHQGRNRLSGHNAPITDVDFLGIIDELDLNNIIVTSSKDTQIKFWDLETESCFKTLVDNRAEVWCLALAGNFLFAGGCENNLNVYKITANDSDMTEATIENSTLNDENNTSLFRVTNSGYIQRAGKGRTAALMVDPTGRIVTCHGTNNLIESFLICSPDQVKNRLSKRLAKIKNSQAGITMDKVQLKDLTLSDEIKRLPSIKVEHRVKSVDVIIGQNNELRAIANLSNNSLQLLSVESIKRIKLPQITLLKTLQQHLSEVRCVCFSSDSSAIATGSAESLKIWNRSSKECFRTIQTDYILSCSFVPGDRHVILGLKTGHLLVIDIGIGEIVEDIPAHENELWSICLTPDSKGIVTGSSDKTVKFWDFELIDSTEQEGKKVLSLLHKNTLMLEETILCLKISPNNKYIAVGLLDSTVKIFFVDSLRFYLSLYGHKLPVLTLDISYDSNLIVTGSADRNIKIWGLDFGDCHSSLFAHDDSVMSVQFIPKTHMFFSCGKDGKVKQWDADIFKKIINLHGHIGEAYSLSISPDGQHLVSCGSDRALRLFELTDETIVLHDIQEQEREDLEDKQLATGDDNNVPTMPGLKMPSRKTVGSEKAAESILEGLIICKEFETNEDVRDLHPLMLAYNTKNSNDFLIKIFQRIRASDLEEALLLLPFSEVCELLQRIPQLIEKRYDQSELVLKISLFLFRIHHKSIVSNHTLLPILKQVISILEKATIDLRDIIGVVLFGSQILQRDIEEREGVEIFKDITFAQKKREEKYKKRELAKRVHIQMS